MTVHFVNKGLIELGFIRAMAVSAKDSENPIGFFGTGMKYALAIVLRHGGKVTMWRGLDRYVFDTEIVELRGKQFSFVTMNGERLPFTIDLGKQWAMWMAYREFFCNALDEGGSATQDPTIAMPHEEATVFSIEHTEIDEIFAQHGRYFYSATPIAEGGNFKLLPRNAQNPRGLYNRGVLIGELQQDSIWTYDMKKAKLTEDRTFSSTWDIQRQIAKDIVECLDENFLRSWLIQPKLSFEHQLDLDHSHTPSKVFLEVVGDLHKTRRHDINPSAVLIWERTQVIVIETFEPTKVQQRMLEKAIEFIKTLGHDVTEFPINCVTALGKGILGEAKNGQIYLTRRVFEMGTKQVASCLLEEFIHLKLGYADHSYDMQNFLFDTIISLREELNGEPL